MLCPCELSFVEVRTLRRALCIATRSLVFVRLSKPMPAKALGMTDRLLSCYQQCYVIFVLEIRTDTTECLLRAAYDVCTLYTVISNPRIISGGLIRAQSCFLFFYFGPRLVLGAQFLPVYLPLPRLRFASAAKNYKRSLIRSVFKCQCNFSNFFLEKLRFGKPSNFNSCVLLFKGVACTSTLYGRGILWRVELVEKMCRIP